jgi:hypothetical protein
MILHSQYHKIMKRIDQNARASLWTGSPSAIATESLKVILFSLANKNLRNLHIFHASSKEARDEFILWMFGLISESNFEWPFPLLGTCCSTTNAILEVVYGCAIRQKQYALISQLLKAGVDPNIPVDLPAARYFRGPILSLERGKMKLAKHLDLSCLKLSALEFAIEPYDIRLATILLDAGVNIGNYTLSLLERIALFTKEDNALECIQLLIRHDVELDLLPALGIAIAKRHNRLVTLFVEKVHQMNDSKRLISYCFESRRDWGGDSHWYGMGFELLQIHCTLLHIAIYFRKHCNGRFAPQDDSRLPRSSFQESSPRPLLGSMFSGRPVNDRAAGQFRGGLGRILDPRRQPPRCNGVESKYSNR